MTKNKKNYDKKGTMIKEDENKKEVLISFEGYFQRKLQKNLKLLPHHKIPMKDYAKKKHLLIGTYSEFEELFRNY